MSRIQTTNSKRDGLGRVGDCDEMLASYRCPARGVDGGGDQAYPTPRTPGPGPHQSLLVNRAL